MEADLAELDTDKDFHGKPVLSLDTLSSTELYEYRERINLVLIPVGSIEQHGPNLALNADTILAKSASHLIGSKLFPQVLVAPEICWGISDHHMAFPGTIRLRPETFIMLIFDLVWSLRCHGFSRFLLINGHSGNRACLEISVNKIFQEMDVNFIGSCQYFDLGPDKGAGHASEVEVSFACALAPEIVKFSNLADGRMTENERINDLTAPYPTEYFSLNGPSGPIGSPSAELGWKRLKPSLLNLLKLASRICSGELDIHKIQ